MCKDQESIQSSTTPDPGYQRESDKLTVDTTNHYWSCSSTPTFVICDCNHFGRRSLTPPCVICYHYHYWSSFINSTMCFLLPQSLLVVFHQLHHVLSATTIIIGRLSSTPPCVICPHNHCWSFFINSTICYLPPQSLLVVFHQLHHVLSAHTIIVGRFS